MSKHTNNLWKKFAIYQVSAAIVIQNEDWSPLSPGNDSLQPTSKRNLMKNLLEIQRFWPPYQSKNHKVRISQIAKFLRRKENFMHKTSWCNPHPERFKNDHFDWLTSIWYTAQQLTAIPTNNSSIVTNGLIHSLSFGSYENLFT